MTSDMTSDAAPAEFAELPPTLRAERHGSVAVLKLARAEKRNALNDPTVRGIETFFGALPDGIRAVVLCGEGDHFSAGLDLSELAERRRVGRRRAFARLGTRRSTASSSARCRWSPCCTAPWSAAGSSWRPPRMCGVAERSAFYALPEASRGIYVGGGGSVRLPPLIGTARVNGHDADRTHAQRRRGPGDRLSQYLVDEGNGLAKGLELAHRIAGNAPFTNFA